MNSYCEKAAKEMDKRMAPELQATQSFRYSIDRIYEQGFIDGKEMQRRLLRLTLGIAVPADLED